MTEYFIGGQKVELTEGGNFKIHIDSIFKSAGMIYKFPNKCSGISINRNIVNVAELENRHLVITIAESPKEYIIHPSYIKELVEKYNSVYEKGDIQLLVFPLNELRPLGEKKISEKETKTEQFWKKPKKPVDKEKVCKRCGSENLDFTDKHYVVCGDCGQVMTRKLFTKR